METNTQVKSFWEKPEGKTGAITLALGALAGGAALWVFGPIILGLLGMAVAITSKAIVASVLAVALWLFWMVVSSSKVQNLVGVYFRTSMKALTNVIVETRPIEIMRDYVSQLKKKLADMDKHISNLRGQLRAVEDEIANNKKQADTSLRTAQAAHDAGKQNLVTLHARQAGRLKNSIEQLVEMHDRMKFLYTALQKQREAASFMVDDMTNEVDMLERQRRVMFAAYSATNAARDIMNGNGDARELFDQAAQYTVDDYRVKMGEIDNFMDVSKNFIDNFDLQNATFDAQALEQIASWQNEGKQPVVERRATKVMQTQPVKSNGSYLSL